MSSNFTAIFILALGLVLIISFSVAFKSFLNFPPPTVEVTDISLNPNTVNVNQVASLSITIKGNDNSKTHFLRMEFESHLLVTFLLGDPNLQQEDGIWYFTTVLNPSASVSQPFSVRANLESGIAQLAYEIVVKFYLDGTNLIPRL